MILDIVGILLVAASFTFMGFMVGYIKGREE